jgi:hypothetical protein
LTDPRAGYQHEIASSEDDDNDVSATLQAGRQRISGAAAPAGLLRARQGTMGNESFVQGFVRGAVNVDSALGVAERWVQPGQVRTPGQDTMHTFAQACSKWYGVPRRVEPKVDGVEATQGTEAPSDGELKTRIDLVAAMVARGGPAMMQLAKHTHQGASLAWRMTPDCRI